MSNVNIFTSKWKATGRKVSVPQFELGVRVNFTNADKVSRDVDRTVLFPDCLLDLPADYVKERITDMLVDYAAIKVGAKAVE